MDDAEEPTPRGWPIDKPFYIIGNGHLDGSLDIESEGMTATRTEKDAVEQASSIVSVYGGVQYLIRCEVVRTFTLEDSDDFNILRHSVFEDCTLAALFEPLQSLYELTYPERVGTLK